ncbi:heterokaryon incompatibility protein-domain-containing protein, partial [Pyrenochaeta sp. MPI-SDFR-AT-0127]
MQDMPPRYLALAEDDIRLLVIEPKIEGDPTVRCTLKHVSLKDTVRDPELTSSRDRIPFEGLQTTVCSEYLHVHANSKRKDLRARGLSRLKRAFRVGRIKEGDIDPLDQPEDYDFTISTGRQRVGGGDPIPKPEELPESWKVRYEWGDFVALSYSWGNPKDTLDIIIYSEGENHETNRSGVWHPVTRNLHAALSQLRESGIFAGKLMLWADALCINQGDQVERGQQCGRMDKIYRQAGNVLVWLGPEVDYSAGSKDDATVYATPDRSICSDHAISYLQWLSAYYRTEILEYLDQSRDTLQVAQFRENANMQLRQSHRMVTSNIRNDFDYIDIDEYGWLSIFHFFDNPYWKRLWIIQELVMGTENTVVVCGDRFTQWRHIRDGALIIAAVSDFLAHRIQDFAKEKRLKMPRLTDRAAEHVAGIAELSIHANRKAIPFVDPRLLAHTSKPGPEDLPNIQGTGLVQLLSVASQAQCYRPGDRVLGMMYIPPFRRTDGLNVAANTTLQDLYIAFARHLILSGKVSKELASAHSDEVAVWTEDTTFSQHGIITETYKIKKYAYNGLSASLDFLPLLDGFVDELMLPSWVPNLAIPEWRKTHPFLGPWHASGLEQGVPLPRLESFQVTGTSTSIAGIVFQGVLVDVIVGLGAIQSL